MHHHESWRCTPASASCAGTGVATASVDAVAPVFVLGVEVPFAVARHFEIAAGARAYFLRRGEHVSAGDVHLDWQNEWRSSTRAALLGSARFVW